MESRESIDLDLKIYLYLLRRRWISVTSIFLGTVSLSILATTLLKPAYESSGKLWFRIPSFKTIGTNLLPNNNEGDAAGDLKSLVSTQNPISTQVEVISSPPLLEKVINKLELTNEKGEPLTVEELQEKLTLKIIGGTDVLEITYQSNDPKQAAAVVNALMNVYVDNDISTNREEAEATRKFMERQLPQTQAAVNYAEAVLRKFREQNNIVDLAEETKTSVGVITGIDNEINAVKAQLADLVAQRNQLSQQLGLTTQQAIAVTTLSQSPAVQGILSQLQELERQLANERSRFTDDNPIIVSLEAKKDNLNNLLQLQIAKTVGLGQKLQFSPTLLQIGEVRQNLINNFLQLELQSTGLNQKLNSLLNTRSAHEKRMQILPKLAQQQRQLERKVEVAESTYQTLLKKVQELQVAENANTANARIIARGSVPEEPLAAKKMLVLVIGAMFGLFLATSTILLLEIKDKSLKTLDKVKEAFNGYTLLGIIPLLPQKTISRKREGEYQIPRIAVRDTPDSLTSEIYRMIQANLKFLSSDKLLKTIVVTSAVAKEGKSTVSANLAAAIAQLGRRVLLIDADMRVSSQHYIWGITSTAGLSEVLVGHLDVRFAVKKVMDNLDILTAGVRPPNSLALLDSKRMASLIKELSSQYDYVIIDAPPALLAADALTLSKMSDGILLVARPGVIDHNSALAAREMLKKANHNVLGLVINGVNEQNEPSNYFYHASEYYGSASSQAVLDKSLK
ncbi:Fis family transcriptional regulator [Calothrix brevissima NIES-22]|nr:Fis family transcriptional regulator [Calothrix brevissima NIES-22]